MSFLALVSFVVAQSLMGGLPIDGVGCNATEGAAEHIHARLQIFDRGKPVPVPANVGIPDGAGCLYWVHTHAASGYIHIESPVVRSFTLGQFFDIWNRDLNWSQAAHAAAPHGQKIFVWINGKAWHGADPRSIVLKDRESIVIQSAPPFAKPAASNWQTL